MVRRVSYTVPKCLVVRIPEHLYQYQVGSWTYDICGEMGYHECNTVEKTCLLLLDTLISTLKLLSRRILPHKEIMWRWFELSPESVSTWIPALVTTRPVKIRGRLAGTIISMGPHWTEISGNPDATRSWQRDIANSSNVSGSVFDDIRISLRHLTAILKSGTMSVKARNFVHLANYNSFEFFWSRLFTATGPDGTAFVGICPNTSQVGDTLVDFWNSDAVLVIRRPKEAMNSSHLTIGRAGIVKGTSHALEDGHWHIPRNRSSYMSDQEGLFSMEMGLSDLTRLSFDTVMLQGETFPQYDDIIYGSNFHPDLWTFTF